MNTVRDTLLKLSSEEKLERKKVEVDYYFYKGPCEDLEKAKAYKPYYGQNWENNDNSDYIPTQDIRNKVKPRLKKQARWMFSKEPDILITPMDKSQKDIAEELRQFIDTRLRKTLFWKKTRQAFLMATIKKRVMLRVAAKNGYLNLKYEDIKNFSYEEIDGELVSARFFEEDRNNAYTDEEDKKIYYIHKFSYEKFEEDKPVKATYSVESYKSNDLEIPFEVKRQDIGFELNKIPCWLIKNGGELGEEFGESDLHDLKPIQIERNKRVSDVADALKFGLFGAETVIDGKEEDVNKFKIVPGALHAVHTDDKASDNGKQATISRQEYSLSGIDAVEKYLDRIDKDMDDILDMPSLDDMNNIPSAKAMRYLYNDLIGRCEEKWNDWGPFLEEVIRYIIAIAEEAKLPGFKKEWSNLEYTLSFNHNYPLPADDEEKKALGISEVQGKVRSIKSYINEFSKEEDTEAAFKEILKEVSLLAGADMSEFTNTSNNNNDEDDMMN